MEKKVFNSTEIQPGIKFLKSREGVEHKWLDTWYQALFVATRTCITKHLIKFIFPTGSGKFFMGGGETHSHFSYLSFSNSFSPMLKLRIQFSKKIFIVAQYEDIIWSFLISGLIIFLRRQQFLKEQSWYLELRCVLNCRMISVN